MNKTPKTKRHSAGRGLPLESIAQLSLTAQFDDFARFTNSLILHGAHEDHIVSLLKSLQDFQIKYHATRIQLKNYHQEIKTLKHENDIQAKKLANVRYCLSKESIARENVTKERNALLKKFKVIKQFFLEEDTQANGVNGMSSNGQQRDKILSALNNLPCMETVMEGDSDIDISGIEFDKTEDEILSRRASSIGNQSRRKSSRGNRSGRKSSRVHNESGTNRHYPDLREFETDIQDVEMDDGDVVIAKETKNDLSPPKSGRYETDMNIAKEAVMKELKSNLPVQSTPNLQRQTDSIAAILKAKVSRADSVKKIHGDRMESRGHSWVRKKNFKPTEKCSHCESNIRFLGETFKCSDCLITCHPDCKSKSDRPCIPMVNRSSVKRGVKPVLADFVSTERPKVPALIYHCIKEIERRGMKEEGLYRLSGSKKEVDSLKDIILSSKNGMPSLDNYDIHSITGVVKAFLSDLRETLTTKFKWKDFVKASQARDDSDVKTMLFQAICELPEANRDTLAFIISHLQDVAEAQERNAMQGFGLQTFSVMNKSNLAKIFAPTIVGNSFSITENSKPEDVWEETKQSIKVMSLLLDLPNDYWTSLLSKSNDSQEDILASVDGIGQADFSRVPSQKRISIGSRPFTGTVNVNGFMTPLKQSINTARTLRSDRPLRKLKPLF